MPSPWSPRRTTIAALCVALTLATMQGCATAQQGDFVWIDDYSQPAPVADGYLIGAGDQIAVQVWDNEKLWTRGRVRADGKMSMPLLNDVSVAGKAPAQVARELERQLRDANLVLNPHVSVLIEEVQAVKVSVLGKVTRPGSYTMEQGAGVAEAIASAGGLNDFADRDEIYLMRRSPNLVRIRFTFKALTAGGRAALFKLRHGDVVVAE